jgi:hypothetical protein
MIIRIDGAVIVKQSCVFHIPGAFEYSTCDTQCFWAAANSGDVWHIVLDCLHYYS